MGFGKLGARGGFGSHGVLGKAGVAFAYYVAANGNDANPGTQSQPWLTLAKVTAQAFQPNTTVYFRGGDTFTGPFTLPSVSGTVGKPIRYTSYGTGQATINSAANNSGIVATNLSYITIDNLNITGPGSASTSGHGINIQWSTASTIFPGVSITNNNISGFASSGIFAGCTVSTAQTSGLLISGTAVSACTYGDTTTSGSAGIYVRGVTIAQTNTAKNHLNPHITLCSTKNNTGVAAAVNWTGSGIFMRDANGGLIDYCVADNNGANSNTAAGPAGIWIGLCTQTKMRYNVSTNNKTAGGDGHGYDMDGGCDNCITEFSFSYNNAGFGFMCFEYDDANFSSNNNNVIRFNAAHLDKTGGLRLVSGGTHANSGQAYCNRLVGSTTTAGGIVKLEDQGGGLNWTVANNSIETQNTGTTDLILTTALHAPNTFFYGNNYLTAGTFRITWFGTAYATMAAWRAGVAGQETIASADTSKAVTGTYVSPSGQPYLQSFNVDPARPIETSPLLNAGVNLFSNFSIDPGPTDLFGSALSTSGPWSIGPGAMKSAVKSVVLSTTGSGNWTVPADFAALFAVDCIGAGGTCGAGGAAGGGGAFARSNLSAITSSWVAGTTTVPYFVGAAVSNANGQDTTFGATTLASAVSLGPNSACGAQGGGNTPSGSVGGAGGQASASVGQTVYSGGSGGTGTAFTQGGGGGAASFFGNGVNGPNGAAATVRGASGGSGAAGGGVGSISTTTAGGGGGLGPLGNGGGAGGNTGAGTAGVGGSGGGGAGNSGGAGGAGGNGLDWSTNGAGGGGGASLGSFAATNVGGLFGGGAGGRGVALGAQGGIRILYKTLASL